MRGGLPVGGHALAACSTAGGRCRCAPLGLGPGPARTRRRHRPRVAFRDSFSAPVRPCPNAPTLHRRAPRHSRPAEARACRPAFYAPCQPLPHAAPATPRPNGSPLAVAVGMPPPLRVQAHSLPAASCRRGRLLPARRCCWYVPLAAMAAAQSKQPAVAVCAAVPGPPPQASLGRQAGQVCPHCRLLPRLLKLLHASYMSVPRALSWASLSRHHCSCNRGAEQRPPGTALVGHSFLHYARAPPAAMPRSHPTTPPTHVCTPTAPIHPHPRTHLHHVLIHAGTAYIDVGVPAAGKRERACDGQHRP